MLGRLHIYMQKIELNPYTSPHPHIGSRWIKDLNIKVVKLLGESGEKKLGIKFLQRFSGSGLKTVNNCKIGKWDGIELKTDAHQKKQCEQNTYRMENCLSYISQVNDQRIYSSQTNSNKKINNHQMT